jgi:hypothetical protein
MQRTFGIVAATLLGVAAALWWLHDDDSPPTATPALSAVAQPPIEAVPARGGPPAMPSNQPATEALASASASSNAPAEELAQALARRVYDTFGSRLVSYLAKQGLSRADAEPIVAELLRSTVSCALDALREQALEQRVDFDQVLNALEAQLYDADGPPVSALIDATALDQRAAPCSMTALSRAGIPPQAAYELFPRQR